jgi:hypothetical protein
MAVLIRPDSHLQMAIGAIGLILLHVQQHVE